MVLVQNITCSYTFEDLVCTNEQIIITLVCPITKLDNK